MKKYPFWQFILIALFFSACSTPAAQTATPEPVVFVTQTPIPTALPTNTAVPMNCDRVEMFSSYAEYKGPLAHGQTVYIPAYGETVLRASCDGGHVISAQISVVDVPPDATIQFAFAPCTASENGEHIRIVATDYMKDCRYSDVLGLVEGTKVTFDYSSHTLLNEAYQLRNDQQLSIGQLLVENNTLRLEYFLASYAISIVMEDNTAITLPIDNQFTNGNEIKFDIIRSGGNYYYSLIQ